MRGRKKPAETKDDGLIRLNRYISNAGICSRRKADELIIAGVVSVNGVVVDELGAKIDPREMRLNITAKPCAAKKWFMYY
jgi:23S rRNA pseudouridine2605 synthase